MSNSDANRLSNSSDCHIIPTEINSVIELLCSATKLERDHGNLELTKLLQRCDVDEASSATTLTTTYSIQKILVGILNPHNNPDSSGSPSHWESKHGSLLGLKTLVNSYCFKRNLYVKENNYCLKEECEEKIIPLCLDLLVDDEVRVRIAAGELLGSFCEVLGSEIYELCNSRVLGLIQENLDRETKETELTEDEDSIKFRDHPAGPIIRRGSIDKTQIFHDTAGWKCLETSMKCLQSMVDGCGLSFRPYIDQHILDLLFQALQHTNRFVRETACFVIGSLVSCGNKEIEENQSNEFNNPFKSEQYGHQVAQKLGVGLTDNWSQVRLAASEATRKFLLSFTNPIERELFYAELLPKMCLNRYYVADGVRIYSQETWRRVAKTQGRELVQKYISNVADYYISQTTANNHAVREAACACIAELASKIDPEAVRPYVPKLLETLLICFQDDSWPVRDAACLASGNFILCYPQESRQCMPQLYPLFLSNLQDCIASVREGAAGALANVVRAYGLEAFSVLESKIKEGLNGLENQTSESEKYVGLEKGPATFGLAKRIRDNDMDSHTDKQMYSCGSLAPKMGRGGCSDHKFRKESEPWEFADGCIHLVAELAQFPELSVQVCAFLPMVAEAALKKHYTHHVTLLESICKRLPNIVDGLGKRQFKSYLEYFLDPIFYSLSCDNALTSSAASQCLNQLAKQLGSNILRARIQEHNSGFVQQFDCNTHLAAF